MDQSPPKSKENHEINFFREECLVKIFIIKTCDINESREQKWKIGKGGNKSKLFKHGCDVKLANRFNLLQVENSVLGVADESEFQ